jgi:hypothetical protein
MQSESEAEADSKSRFRSRRTAGAFSSCCSFFQFKSFIQKFPNIKMSMQVAAKQSLKRKEEVNNQPSKKNRIDKQAPVEELHFDSLIPFLNHPMGFKRFSDNVEEI